MTLEERLQAHRQLTPLSSPRGPLYTKPGVRGYPGVHPGVALFSEAELAGRVLDATGTGGAVALAAPGETVVLEPSRAALTAAATTFRDHSVTLAAGAPWDAAPNAFDTLCLLPATDRGNLRVFAELRGAQRALRAGGTLFAVMHKDQGAKRYEKHLAERFADTAVLARSGGWRLVRARGPREASAPPEPISFDAAGLTLEAEPGVYAAGKLDPGTAALLAAYPLADLAGRRVLDLGCGYGMLALKSALAGADATALDDDLTAVRSTARNARRYGLDVRALHSDLDFELRGGERFDLVLTNPPFHVGKDVRLELPFAFIAAAAARLAPGGELVLVANRALPYEPLLAQVGRWDLLAESGGFKVLRARA